MELVDVLMADELLFFYLTMVISCDHFYVMYFFESFWPNFAASSSQMSPQWLLTPLSLD